MSNQPRYRFLLFILFLLVTQGVHAAENADVFPTPSILVDNVAFWKKIYTEVTMKEGLLHDREYPLVIYEKIVARSGSKTVKQHRRKVSSALKRIATEPEHEWSAYEKKIAAIFYRHADSSAIGDAGDRLRFQQGQKERFKEGLRRSGRYLDTIRAILTEYKVPLRLAYLPHVESSFNTEAYSKVGAAGLWQFMRGTGKTFGMRITYAIDERRDPILATIGAAKYLSSSYAELGTWPLAITSYNHGVYGMKRAVKQTGSRDIAVIIRNYKSRSFRFASSNFYSCFLAASAVADTYTKYFPGLTLYPPLAYHDFTLSHYIGADDFSTFIGIPKDELRKLNPALRPTIFSKHQQLPKGYIIHIPATKSLADVATAYNGIPDSLKMSSPPRPQYYRVRRGDNLYAIANRLGVSIRELAYENNITRINRIRAGQILRIPPKAVATKTVVAKAKPEPVTEQQAEDTVVTVASTTPAEKADTTQEETTVSEAAAEIARAEDEASLPPEEVAMVDTNKKSFWEKLKPPSPAETGKTENKVRQQKPPPASALSDSLKEIALAPAIVEPAKTPAGKPRIGPEFDVAMYDLDAILTSGGTEAKIFVSVDETIGHYADWLGIPTWRIRKLNGMGRRSNIRIYQKLHIPIDRPDALEQFYAARLEYHMAIEEDFYAQYTVTDVQPYTLKRGETLWDICNDNENPLPLWLFTKYNRHTNLTRLQAGSELWIPQVREMTEEEISDLQQAPPPPPRRQRPELYRHRLQDQQLTP